MDHGFHYRRNKPTLGCSFFRDLGHSRIPKKDSKTLRLATDCMDCLFYLDQIHTSAAQRIILQLSHLNGMVESQRFHPLSGCGAPWCLDIH